MTESLAKYYKDGKEPYVVFSYSQLRETLAGLQKEAERSLQKRMVALRERRLVEDITQVRHRRRRELTFPLRGGTVRVVYTPAKKILKYRMYEFKDGRHVFVGTLSEMEMNHA